MTPVTATESKGRFVLHSAEYSVLAGDGSLSLKGLFKIDSETGKTWILVSGNGPAYWLEVNDRFSGKVSN